MKEFTKLENFSVEKCDESCGEHELVSWRTGRCEGCPFGAYWDEDGCVSCELVEGSFNFEAYMEGTQCVQSGDHEIMFHAHAFLLGKKPVGIPRDNRHHHKVHLEGKLDVCYIVHQRQEFSDFCEDKYDNLDDLSFDDLTDFDLTMMACLVMDRIDEIYDSNCGDREYSWPTTDRFGVDWLDAACMVVSHIQHTAENIPDGDIDRCDEVDEEHRIVTMPFDLEKGFTNDINWGSILFPLLSHVESMTHADFSTVTTAVQGMMKRLGLFDTDTVTGLMMSSYLRDLIIHTPENLKMSAASYELMNEVADVFCDNGNIKKDCRSACAEPYNQCQQAAGDTYELTCHADECRDCEVSFTYGEDVEYSDCVVEEDCEHVNGGYDYATLVLVDVSPENNAKLYHFQCDSGYRLDGDAEDCMEEKWKGFGCEEGTAVEAPSCVEDMCEMPEGIENGFVKYFHNDARHTCRYAEMACNPGYRLEGDPICICDMSGTWPGEMPTCVPVDCEGDDSTIENGQLINHLVGTKNAWYRCDVNNPDYNGDMDYFSANHCGETLVCGEHKADHCPPTIKNGYKVRQWEHIPDDREKEDEVAMEDKVWNAEYRCNNGYDIEDNEHFADQDDKHGWAKCTHEEDHLPTCVKSHDDDDDDDDDDDEHGPCKMPETIPNGELLEEFLDDQGRVSHGQYKCDTGYMMMETVYGDIGFCRNDYDRSYELPQCVLPDDWVHVEFEIVHGFSKKMDNAGRVKARYVYHDGSDGGWFMGCDDHFNHPAAAAICHSLDFMDGKMIDAPKRMKPVQDVPFGVTNFYCMYPDLLATRLDLKFKFDGFDVRLNVKMDKLVDKFGKSLTWTNWSTNLVNQRFNCMSQSSCLSVVRLF